MSNKYKEYINCTRKQVKEYLEGKYCKVIISRGDGCPYIEVDKDYAIARLKKTKLKREERCMIRFVSLNRNETLHIIEYNNRSLPCSENSENNFRILQTVANSIEPIIT